MVHGKEKHIFIVFLGEDIFVHLNPWKQMKDIQNILEKGIVRKYVFVLLDNGNNMYTDHLQK